jgi:hypothetical protein
MLRRHHQSPAISVGVRNFRQDAPSILWEVLSPYVGVDGLLCQERDAEANKHQTVEIAENKFLRGFAPQHIDLLPENQDLRFKPRS